MLGSCLWVPTLVTVVSQVTNGVITKCSVELLNCISLRSVINSFNAVFYCGIVALQYLGVINGPSITLCLAKF